MTEHSWWLSTYTSVLFAVSCFLRSFLRKKTVFYVDKTELCILTHFTNDNTRRRTGASGRGPPCPVVYAETFYREAFQSLEANLFRCRTLQPGEKQFANISAGTQSSEMAGILWMYVSWFVGFCEFHDWMAGTQCIPNLFGTGMENFPNPVTWWHWKAATLLKAMHFDAKLLKNVTKWSKFIKMVTVSPAKFWKIFQTCLQPPVWLSILRTYDNPDQFVFDRVVRVGRTSKSREDVRQDFKLCRPHVRTWSTDTTLEDYRTGNCCATWAHELNVVELFCICFLNNFDCCTQWNFWKDILKTYWYFCNMCT